MPGVDPRTYVPHCTDCGERVRPQQPGVWAEVTGWIENRQGGGANAVALAVPSGRYRCAPCMKLRRLGVSPDQEALPLDG